MIKIIFAIIATITIGIVVAIIGEKKVDRACEIRDSDSKDMKISKNLERINGITRAYLFAGYAMIFIFIIIGLIIIGLKN